MKEICIYCLTNKINGKKYIWQTVDIEMRIYKHFNEKLCIGKGDTFSLDKMKYGRENFELTILKKVNKKRAFYEEREMIKKYDTVKNGYNIEYSSGVNEDEDEKLIEEYKKGKTINNIAKENHTDTKRLARVIKANGIDTYMNDRFRPLTKEKYEKAKNMFINGKSLREIERELHICRKNLSKKLKEENIVILNKNSLHKGSDAYEYNV